MDQYTTAGFWHPKGEHHNLQDVQPLVAIWQHHLITHAIRHSPFGLPCLWDGRFYLSFGAWQREIAGTKYPGHLMRQETWNMTFGLWVWWSGENIIWSTMDCTYFGKLCFGSFNLFWLACLFAFVHIFWVYGCSVPIRFLGCMVFAWLKIQNMVTSSQGEMDILNAVPFFKTHYIVFLICIYIYIRCSFSKPRNHTGEVYHEGSLVWTRTSFVQPQVHAYDRQMFFLDVICSMNVIYEYLTKRVQNCESK